jgi:hypothetical protein
MTLPVSLRTDRPALLDIARTPRLGSWFIVLLALGPPTLLGLLALAVDAVRGWATGATWGVVASEPPFLGPLYFAVVFGAAIPWDLALARRFGVRIKLLFVPVWAFAAGSIALLLAFGTSAA